jgi:hypothetical protein
MHRRSIVALLVVVAVIGVGGMGASAAQNASLADHPVVGAWMFQTPIGTTLVAYHADGTFVGVSPVTSAGSQGVTFGSGQIGIWEPTGERTVHSTNVGLLTDANGVVTGSITFDGSERVSEDGQTIAEEPGASLTIRDAGNNVVQVIPGAGAAIVHGVRMAVGAPGFPEVSAAPGVSPSTTP